MKSTHSMVISMRLPAESGKRLKRMANRHGWTPSDASARLVEEGLRRSEFGFIDFRDSPAGRQAYLQGSTLAVWEVMLLVHSYKEDVSAVARHLKWPEMKVQAAINYAGAFPGEINDAIAENEATDFETLKRMLPQAAEFVPDKAAKN
jgi:predicted alpha-1,6-mannanase (GH76 family)